MTTTNLAAPTSVDFWFDPICPWAWIASRWLLEVQQVRSLEVRWNVMSLAMLNEGRDLSADYKKGLSDSWGPVRLVTAARQQRGDEVVLPLYTALGRRIHEQHARRDRALAEAALAEVGLSPEFVEAMESDAYDAPLRESHERGLRLVGMDVGTPIVAIGQTALFGPVVSPIPRGEAAGRLWDAVAILAQTDGFYELKRTRDREPIFD